LNQKIVDFMKTRSLTIEEHQILKAYVNFVFKDDCGLNL